jgi:hypothetical protein
MSAMTVLTKRAYSAPPLTCHAGRLFSLGRRTERCATTSRNSNRDPGVGVKDGVFPMGTVSTLAASVNGASAQSDRGVLRVASRRTKTLVFDSDGDLVWYTSDCRPGSTVVAWEAVEVAS